MQGNKCAGEKGARTFCAPLPPLFLSIEPVTFSPWATPAAVLGRPPLEHSHRSAQVGTIFPLHFKDLHTIFPLHIFSRAPPPPSGTSGDNGRCGWHGMGPRLLA